MPVIINSLACVPTNSKNSKEVDEFISFMLSDNMQKKLVKMGCVSGNKKANESIQGSGKTIIKHLSTADDNSIVYIYNLPEKFEGVISSKIDSIIGGKYTGKEWTEIVNDVYK